MRDKRRLRYGDEAGEARERERFCSGVKWQVCNRTRHSQLKIKGCWTRDRKRETWGTLPNFDRLKGQVEGQEEPGEWMERLEKEVVHEERERETECGRMKAELPLRGWFKKNRKRNRGWREGGREGGAGRDSVVTCSIFKKCHDYTHPLPWMLMHACKHTFSMSPPIRSLFRERNTGLTHTHT